MYVIIGGDGKEYGPISGEDLRKWIAEGRLDAQSLVKAESDAEFRPLSTFPELANALAPGASAGVPPPLAATSDDGYATALQRAKAPAVALMVSAILNLALGAWSLVQTTLLRPTLQEFMQNSWLQKLFKLLGGDVSQLQQLIQKAYHISYGPFGVVNALFQLALSALILMGAVKMQALRSYEFSATAAVLAMLPCLTPCCIFGLPFGIWALVVLRSPGVKSHFH